jgi:hydrophobe/amphiphile efflux-1 (HAE1) family protein
MARLFIHRPVLAIVMSLIVLIAGGISIFLLPVAQYPEISPPTVMVATAYIGANADTVEQTVAAPIEQQVNGVENLLYMQSQSGNDGSYALTCTFKVGTNVDIAQVQVQNRVTQATPILPAQVIQSGVMVLKRSTNIVQIVSLFSPDKSHDELFLNNYALVRLVDELARLPGVGQVGLGAGRNYAMRFWVRPDRLAQLGVNTADLISAINEQNVQAPVGGFGLPPAPGGQRVQLAARTEGRLTTVEEFENIVVKSQRNGQVLHLRDVARTELGAQDYQSAAWLSGEPSATILAYQLPGSNALDVAAEIQAKMKQLAKSFPPGVGYRVSLDTTRFVSASVEEVMVTLGEAMALVIFVVYVFLGNWRATLIPLLAVPVSLVGTFAAFVALGFSINLLTLFALVLAIGIVVDDAIVVVEAVEHHIEEGLAPVAATEKAMSEVSAPVVGIALVLTSVFVPVAFLGGITGQLYRQFALTLSVSVLLSAGVALTLTPALCAMMLRHRKKPRGPLGWALYGFNRLFGRATNGYVYVSRWVIRLAPVAVLLLLGLYGATWWMVKTVPTSFLPIEDQGYLIVGLQLPDGSSLARTSRAMIEGAKIIQATPGVDTSVGMGGFGILAGANTSSVGTFFIALKPWKERESPDLAAPAIAATLNRRLASIPEASVMVVQPPSIMGLGISGGFQMEVQDQSGGDIPFLDNTVNRLLEAARGQPKVGMIYSAFRPNVPQIRLDVDREKVKSLQVPLNDVFQTMQAYLGGYYVNQFNLYGRTWRVYVQAEPGSRSDTADLSQIYVRSGQRKMVPLSTIVSANSIAAPDSIMRYNMYRAADIQGQAAPGVSSGEALAAMEDAARALPEGTGYAWTGTAYQEKESGSQQGKILALSLVFVFLCLAALYESWTIPFSVLLGVPIGMFGAFLAVWRRGLSNDIYVQIGLIMLIGLAAKNAILIVEYARTRHEEHGMPLVESALLGARLRFRPILMTSFAFILGVFPMVISSGAGAGSRHSLGTAVCFGMLAATSMGVFVIPLLYVLVEGLKEKITGKRPASMPVALEGGQV